MAMLHRALFTWFVVLVFLILLALRLDSRTSWDWFIVFVPCWFYDAILIIHITIHMINECRGAGAAASGSHTSARQRLQALAKRLWPLAATLLKIAFCVTLCLRLNATDKQNTIPTYFVLLPLWVLLLGLCGTVFHRLLLQHNHRYP
ncbi:unnamed protein product [Meganyctiphanes norvegica]|uniref:Transmembrane protein 60 n=1 Tax=Meganyctiphanes norvegica TaxID=48144 RepID=A0AAV2RLA7_MEGNR